MWRTKKDPEYISIIFTPQKITAAHISKPSDGPFSLQSLTSIPLKHLELEHLLIFNPTAISALISEISIPNELPVYFALQGPNMHEKQAYSTQANPSLEDFSVPLSSQWLWHNVYLYPHEHSYYFYLCGMKQSILLQYKLLALNLGLDLQKVSSGKMALFQLYKHLFGPAFRPAQLGNDLMSCNNITENLFNADDLSRIITTHGHTITEHDHLPLLTACGMLV